MNQRAASIPSIADAVSSMLTKTDNPALQLHLSYLPQDPRAWIAKSLWSKAQAQLPKRKAPKKQRRFFPSIDMPSMAFASQCIPTHNDDAFSDIFESDLDEGGDFDSLQTDIDYEPDEPLGKSNSQASFQALCDTTQMTLDSFLDSPSTVSISGADRDSEMLLSSASSSCECDLVLTKVESFCQLDA